MKTLRIVLMSLAVVIAFGAAFASTNSKVRVFMWVSSSATGSPGSSENITLPQNCLTSNDGDPCTVASGTHAGKYIFDTDQVTRYRKPQ